MVYVEFVVMARISRSLCLWQWECFQCFCELRKVTGKTVLFFMLRRADMLMTVAANLGLGQDEEEIWILRTDHRSTSRVFTEKAD